MTQWRLNFTAEAEKDLLFLDKKIAKRIAEKLKWFIANFEQVNHLPLAYKWQGFFKLRVSDWRIVYEIDWANKIITTHRIKHRRDVYE